MLSCLREAQPRAGHLPSLTLPSLRCVHRGEDGHEAEQGLEEVWREWDLSDLTRWFGPCFLDVVVQQGLWPEAWSLVACHINIYLWSLISCQN